MILNLVSQILRWQHWHCRIIVPIPEGKRFVYSDLSYHLIKFEEQRVFEIHLRKSLQLSSAVLIRYIGFKLHDREGSKGEKCKNNSKMKLPKASSTILILFKIQLQMQSTFDNNTKKRRGCVPGIRTLAPQDVTIALFCN